MVDKVERTEQEWREVLSKPQFTVLRQKGTERAFTGAYWDTKDAGTYACAGCGTELYTSDTKYDSGCGWPSFTQGLADDRIVTETDTSHGMVRTEIMCAACGGHLGHVFPDGPTSEQHPQGTGLRHCVNSLSLDFRPADQA